MKVREKTGFSFFTVVEYTSHDDEWPDFHEDREGYNLAEEKWLNAIDEVIIQEDLFVDDGFGWNFPNNNYGLNDIIFPNKPPIPGTPHFIAEEKYRAKCERTYSWGRYYASFNETGIKMRSFCFASKIRIPFFPINRLGYEINPHQYIVNRDLTGHIGSDLTYCGYDISELPYSKKELKQYYDMCELFQRDDMFELEDTITPHKLGLHDPYEIEVGMESPYFVGKKNNGRGSYFFYKSGLYVADKSEDVTDFVDGHYLSDGTMQESTVRTRHIPEDVRDAVWRRDEGKCTKCGSNENLEFDHIIPHSKGGANTKRNIQLLCEPCNRKKSDKIG